MDRRGFLALSTALLLPSLTGAAELQAACRPALSRMEVLRVELIRYARSLTTRHALGNAWLRAQQPQPALDQLLDELTAQLAETNTALAEHFDVGGLMAMRVRRDFEAGHVVHLHGWMLSAAETQLCGIASLLADRASLS